MQALFIDFYSFINNYAFSVFIHILSYFFINCYSVFSSLSISASILESNSFVCFFLVPCIRHENTVIIWTKSSTSSLIILIPNTKIKGIIAVKEVKGLIMGILWIIAVNKKYTFDNLENWYNNPFGKKVKILYLVVLIVLSFNFNNLFLLLLLI